MDGGATYASVPKNSDETALLPGMLWSRAFFIEHYESNMSAAEILDRFEAAVAKVEKRISERKQP